MDVVRLDGGPFEIEIVPYAGARFHRLRAHGHDLLRTPDDPRRHREDPFFWGAYVMAPWCGRSAAGPLTVAGRTVDLAPNFPDGTAIHGQVYGRAWAQVGDAAFEVEAGGDGWPWRYRVRFEVAIRAAVIASRLTLTNIDDGLMPAGLGLHPWFRRPLDAAIRARSVFGSNEQSPTHPSPVAGALDLRDQCPFPTGLDATWTDLDAPPSVVLSWPAWGMRADLATSGAFIVAASPPEPDAVAIEPQTHAPNGLRRTIAGEPGGLTRLAAGASLGLDVRLAVEISLG